MSAEPARPAFCLILAAGAGTRMKSAIPKMLHTLCGRSMLGHVVAAVQGLEPRELAVVVGHGREQTVEHLAGIDPGIRTVAQEAQNGTGHAVRIAVQALADAGVELDGDVVVVYGDHPLMTTGTLDRLLAAHRAAGNAATLLSAVLDDPTGYGRVVRRSGGGGVERIVEQRDATPEQRAITEVNSGMCVFDAKRLADALGRLTAANAQGEEYLTDVFGILAADGHAVDAHVATDPQDVLGAIHGVNDRAQLAELRRIFNERLTRHWMLEGATIVDPCTTWIDVQVRLGRDVTVHPNTQLHGDTVLEDGAEVGPNCTLTDTFVGSGARVTNATAEGAEIGPEANVGPYTYLRAGTRLGRRAKAGGFVEMKKAVVGEGSKVPHLSYIGDTEIGVGSNIGAGTITANYDGVNKHRTEIGDHVFVGSDTVLVAPAKVASGAYVAAGSAITEPVPPGAIGVARGRQRNVEGWVERRRAGTKSAEAASAARAALAAESAASAAGSAAAEGGEPPR